MKIVTASQMAKIESKAIMNGAIDADFMEEAGVQIARLVHAFIERNDLEKQVVILAGKGKNAGDAYVAGIHLLKLGYSVDALQLFAFKACDPLCQINQTKFFNAGGLVKEVLSEEEFALPLYGVILDGIFGTGFKGEVEEPIATFIYKANASRLPIIAIDIPSGLNGDTGIASQETIIATETAFLGLPKMGFFLNDGWNHVGKLNFVDFGLPHKYVDEIKENFVMIDLSLCKTLMPKIKRNRNKYEAGFVTALAGSSGMSGAAILSSWSALKSGSGIVKLICPKEIQNELLSAPYELIKIPYDTKDYAFVIEHLNKGTAVLIGPGLGKEEVTCKLLKKVLPKIDKPCVIDADALNIISENKITLPKNAIFTPHKGEMERLLKKEKQKLDLPFIEMCKEYANKKSITLILKGGPTFIFQPGHPVYVNITGDPGMATAGSGDVLTGILASLLSQGNTCFDASILGTFLHGIAGESAADEKTSYCMTASDIIQHLPNAFKSLK